MVNLKNGQSSLELKFIFTTVIIRIALKKVPDRTEVGLNEEKPTFLYITNQKENEKIIHDLFWPVIAENLVQDTSQTTEK